MKYVEPEIEILKFEKGDVIKTSGEGLGDGGGYKPDSETTDHDGWKPNN